MEAIPNVGVQDFEPLQHVACNFAIFLFLDVPLLLLLRQRVTSVMQKYD